MSNETHANKEKNKNAIIATVKDLVANFIYYDRKEDEDLEVGDIEKSIANGDMSIKDIVSVFESELTKRLG